jgi:hypothetical protein
MQNAENPLCSSFSPSTDDDAAAADEVPEKLSKILKELCNTLEKMKSKYLFKSLPTPV